ncbi:MAG TPA: hypothetical protein VHQ46_05905 [Desulfobacteria bacterium]|nr:hypothetical protein [Desulfobacteria bacterium]
MPYCLDCGNDKLFSSELVSPEVPFVNPPLPLQANFSPQGHLETIEYTGSDQDLSEDAFDKPQEFFNVCSLCGSKNIVWHH